MKINRAPVLTLWAAVVAEQLGYPKDTALTLGKALAGLNAQSKGQRLGIFEPADDRQEKGDGTKKQTPPLEHQTVRLMGREIPMIKTDQGFRADVGGQVIEPGAVQKYLEQKFKDNLSEVRQAMQKLANSLDPVTLNQRGFTLYEKFRPEIPDGTRGWGAAGELDVEKIQKLAEKL